MRRVGLVDVMLVAGLLLLTAGVAMFDWRVALMVCGVLLLAGGVYGMTRGA